VTAQVDRDLTNVSCFDRLLGLIKNWGVTKTQEADHKLLEDINKIISDATNVI
jgi:hypothetical protein